MLKKNHFVAGRTKITSRDGQKRHLYWILTSKFKNVFIVVSSWFVLIELVLLISGLLTKCKNSKYFLSYHKKCKQVFLWNFNPFWPSKWTFFVLFYNKNWNFKFFSLKLYQIVFGLHCASLLGSFGHFRCYLGMENSYFHFLGPIFTKIPISQESLSENSCEVLGGRGLKLSRYHPYIILFKI